MPTKIMAGLMLGVLTILSGCGATSGNKAAKNELGQSLVTPGTASSVPGQQSPSPTGNKEAIDDLLRKGDGLIIRLSSVPAEDQGVYEVRIDEVGQISMPYIGSLSADGLTSADLKKKIENAYRSQKIYTNPNVTVVTVERRFVDVSGEVRMPQRVPYTKDLTAYGAIASCGGFTDYADRRRVKLLRGDKVIVFNALDIATDPSKDILLQPNDKINVTRSIF